MSVKSVFLFKKGKLLAERNLSFLHDEISVVWEQILIRLIAFRIKLSPKLPCGEKEFSIRVFFVVLIRKLEIVETSIFFFSI
jgi:hypothetical protein